MSAVFELTKKIYYHDTDCGGVVYYANYLKHLEEARTEFCAAHGIETAALAGEGVFFVVSHVELDYKASARYGDWIAVSVEIEKVGRSSVYFLQRIKRGETLLVEARVVWVCVGENFRPHSLPDEVKTILSGEVRKS